MEDWEDEPVPDFLKKEKLPNNNWDDEDLSDNDIKDSWEDEDEPALTPKVEEPSSEKAAPKKVTTKPIKKQEKTAEVINVAPLDPVEEKLRQQRLVEEADYKSTTELFAKKDDDKTLDNFIPKSESDFAEYAELVANKLRPYEKSFHYVGLLKSVIRLSSTSLKGSDTRDIASSVTAIANEKVKAEKDATSKKKTAGKKKQLHVGKPDDDAVVAGQIDDYDDYDFM